MNNKTNSLNLTPKNVIDIIFRNKVIIIITFIIGLFITAIKIQFEIPLYDANVKMLVRGQNIISSETYAPIMGFGTIHMTQAEIVKSYPVLKRAVIALDLQNRPIDYEKKYCSNLKKIYIDFMINRSNKKSDVLSPEKQEELKLETAIEDLKNRLIVSMLPGTDIFIIRVLAFTPEEAIETANVISRSYTMFDQIQQLAEVRMRYGEFHPTVIQLEDNIRDATNNLSGKPLPDIQAIGTASVKIIEQATSTGIRIGKSKKVILSVGLFTSLVISFGLALVLGLLNRSIKTPQDIIDYLDIPYIGSITKKKSKDTYLITDKSPDTQYYNFYEELSEQLLVFLKTQGLKTVVITSPSPGNNHKYVVPNIGYILSRVIGNKILLIDLNFNHPNFTKLYSINEEKGIDENFSLDLSKDIVLKQDKELDIIPTKSIQGKTSTILRDIDFAKIIEFNRNIYDAILIDATSVSNMKDVSYISKYCNGTVIIIDEGKLQRQMLKNSLIRLNGNNGVLIGCILNNRTFPIPGFIYKYFKYFIE